jgi:HAMP domain-containing protein
MWMLFFIVGLIAAIALCIHINLEVNALGKSVDTLTSELKRHYGIK